MLGFASPFSFGADYYFSSAGSSGASHYSDAGSWWNEPARRWLRRHRRRRTGRGPRGDVRAPASTLLRGRGARLLPQLLATRSAWSSCTSSTEPAFMYPGADAFVPADWADLTISEAPGPTGRIVFESNRDGQLEIYRMDADGSAPTRLTNNAATDNLPAISPDGTKVAFTSNREGTDDIYVMDINGGGVTRLTSDAASRCSRPGRPTARRSPTTAAASSSSTSSSSTRPAALP